MGLKFYKGTAAEYNAKKDKIGEGGLVVTKENNSSSTGNLYINDNGTHVQLSSNKALTDITLAGNTLTGVALDGSSKTVTLPSITVDSAFSTTSTNAVQNKIVTAKINTIEGNIGTNATNITKNAEDIAKNKEDIAKNIASIGTNTSAISTLNTNLGNLSSTVSAEQAKVSTAQTDIGNLQESVSILQQTAVTLGEADESINDRIDGIDVTIGGHTQAISGLEDDVSDLSKDISDAESRLQQSINANSDLIGGHTEALTSVNSNVAKLQGEMSSAQSAIANHSTKLGGIEGGAQVNKIESISVNGVTQTITNKKVDIAVPSGQLANLDTVAYQYLDKTTVQDVIEGKLDKSTYNSKMTLLEGADSAMQGDINALKTAVGNSTSIAKDIEDAVKAAKTELTNGAIKSAEDSAKSYADNINNNLKNNEIKTINDTLGQHDNRISTVELFFEAAESSEPYVQKLKEIQTYIEDDKSGASALIARVGTNETNIGTLQSDVSVIKAKNEEQDGVLQSAREGAFNKIEHIKINNQEFAIDTGTKTASITLGTVAFLNTIAKGNLESQLSNEIDGKVDKSEYSQTIASLESKDSGFTQNITDINTSLAKKAEQSTVDSLAGNVNKNISDITILGTDLSKTKEDVAKNIQDIGSLGGQVEGLSNTVTGHGQILSSIPNEYATKAALNSTDNTVAGHGTRIKDLEDTRIRGVRIDTGKKKLYVTPASGGNEVPYDIPDTTYTAATTSKDGLMSKSDKSKLDGLPQIKFCTKAQYESYGSGVNSDGIIYFIKG